GALGAGTAAGDAATRAVGFAPRGSIAAPRADPERVAPNAPQWLVPPLGGDAAAESGGASGESGAADQSGAAAETGGGDGASDRLSTDPADPSTWREHFVVLQRDRTVADIARGVGAGMRSVEHLKRYTSIGTAHDQGRTSGLALAGVMARMLETAGPPGVGLTTFRAPVAPVSFAAIAGRERGELFDPARRTAMHDWHVERGAAFEDVGQWKRPWYYPRPGESMEGAVLRECAAVRSSAGFMDASTLGKIEVRGADAGLFLDRIVTNTLSTLRVGRARYHLMCHADGMIFDDGVTFRLADDRFLVTTTTGGAAGVLDWVDEWLQTEWPTLDVTCTSVTEQWSTIVVAGPRSREIVARVFPGVDASASAFPFMSVRQAETSTGVAARLARVSFSGELSFELSVPAWHGRHAWELVAAAGADALGGDELTPYGTETMHVLRAEKGFIIVGQDTDGTVTPYDAGLGWMVHGDAGDFIGKRSYARADAQRPDRRQLVGVVPVAGGGAEDALAEGAQLVDAAVAIDAAAISADAPIAMQGHVTSAYASAALGHRFGLALVSGGRDRIGGRLQVFDEGRVCDVELVSPTFVDPENARRDGVPDAHGAELGAPGVIGEARVPDDLPDRIGPAAHLAHEMRVADVDGARGVTIRELPFAGMTALRAVPGTPGATALEDALAAPLPARVGAVAHSETGSILWLGPDEFVHYEPEPRTDLVALSAAIAAHPAADAIDVSANRTTIELLGPGARAVLAKGCALDLHDRAMPAGSAFVTEVGRIPVVLWRTEPERYLLLPRASFAEHLVRWLIDASRELA
ncbi:MAG: sarcosine oxidase subunit gamma family protein, partial [Pseudoclavibacter sp.]